MTYSKPCIIQQQKNSWLTKSTWSSSPTFQLGKTSSSQVSRRNKNPTLLDRSHSDRPPIHPENLAALTRRTPIRFDDDPPVVEHPKKKGSALENTGLEFEGCDFSLNSLPKVAKLQHTRKLDKAIGDVFFLANIRWCWLDVPRKKNVKHLIVWYVYT